MYSGPYKGARVTPDLGEPFDDWIDRIYAPENRGPDNRVADPRVVYRAVSPEEAAHAEAAGVFSDPAGAGVYVAPDPERYVGGGAYGGRGRGAIYELDVEGLSPLTRAGGAGIQEIAYAEIPTDRVRRVWEWDDAAAAHLLTRDLPEDPSFCPDP